MTILAIGIALAVLVPASQAADLQTSRTEENATKFCKAGNVVWFNSESKIYLPPGSQFYGKTKAGGFTSQAFVDKAGFRANKGSGWSISAVSTLAVHVGVVNLTESR